MPSSSKAIPSGTCVPVDDSAEATILAPHIVSKDIKFHWRSRGTVLSRSAAWDTLTIEVLGRLTLRVGIGGLVQISCMLDINLPDAGDSNGEIAENCGWVLSQMPGIYV
jgi:hypothetical protein